MKIHPKALVQSLVLVSATSILLTGCGNNPEVVQAPAAVTTVGTEIDDSVVTTKVKSALLGDPEIKSLDVKVETRKGKVQLSGFVDSQARMDSIIALARKVEGVKDIENGMTLKDGKATVGNVVDDSILTGRVKTALLADVHVKSLDVAVVSRKGEVLLSGYVNNQSQIDRAVQVAGAVEGAQSVKSEMSIKK